MTHTVPSCSELIRCRRQTERLFMRFKESKKQCQCSSDPEVVWLIWHKCKAGSFQAGKIFEAVWISWRLKRTIGGGIDVGYICISCCDVGSCLPTLTSEQMWSCSACTRCSSETLWEHLSLVQWQNWSMHTPESVLVKNPPGILSHIAKER